MVEVVIFTRFLKKEIQAELVVTFMSLLELMLSGDVNVEQSNNFEHLIVSYVKEGEVL